MKKKTKEIDELVIESFTTELWEKELSRVEHNSKFNAALKSTIGILITVAAIAVLVATLWLPVFQVFGSSMTPTLQDGQIVISIKKSTFDTGDIIAFYYNNKILVKRVIAEAGEWVDLEDDGTVLVNSNTLEEPYLQEKAFGDCNIALPYQVPESRVFVMGDHRAVSIDSRNTAVGCVAEEQIVGKLVFRVWPLSQFGKID